MSHSTPAKRFEGMTMRNIFQNGRCHLRRWQSDCTGQATVELAFIIIMLLVMMFGLIDFGRAIYERQVITNIAREGSNLAFRGVGDSPEETVTNAVNAVIASASPLNINTKGRVIISAVVKSNTLFRVTIQLSKGANITATSKLRSGIGTLATMPVTTTPQIPQANKTMYVTEVFYNFVPITPVGKLLKLAFPTQLYDVAYF
jgi:Flp pilus assembly protein TadG